MTQAATYDAVIIGAGATGSWSAYALSRGGFSVALVDAGPVLQTVPPMPYLSPRSHPYSFPRSRPFDWFRLRAIGGRMNKWGGMCLRFSDRDLRGGEGDDGQASWPIGYADLARHYARVEKQLRVIGQRDGLAQVPDGEVIEYAPDVWHYRFKRTIERRTRHRRVIAGRLATRSIQEILLSHPRADKIDVLPGLVATEIVPSGDGARAETVRVIHTESGGEAELAGRAIIVCASTIETARLLLNSRSRFHPRGLGNSSGLVGRYLMEHTRIVCEGIVPLQRGSSDRITEDGVSYSPARPMSVNPGRTDNRAHASQWFWRPCDEKPDAGQACRHRSVFGDTPHAGHFEVFSFGEVRPNFHNRVEVSGKRKDSSGQPIAHISFGYSDGERRLMEDQVASISADIERAGLLAAAPPAPNRPGGSLHEIGTARMGTKPDASVLDPNNRSWDVANLYVMDGSCFVSSAVQNPTLTMLAICDRACDRLARRLRRGSI